LEELKAIESIDCNGKILMQVLVTSMLLSLLGSMALEGAESHRFYILQWQDVNTGCLKSHEILREVSNGLK
jgi:hypothetical protein